MNFFYQSLLIDETFSNDFIEKSESSLNYFKKVDNKWLIDTEKVPRNEEDKRGRDKIKALCVEENPMVRDPQHIFFIDLMMKLLAFDPDNRWSAEEAIKKAPFLK
uniref:Protein kinase domain-containing protein n=1 Tax=Panagrolaimus sp. PS1159 TaxID=55785 RepID=A0AC35FDF7_9BILA